MNARASLTKLTRLVAEQKRRELSRIKLTIHEFSLVAAELDEEIAAEEARVGIFDPNHFAYPCYAKAAAQRRDNLRRSVEDLKLWLEKANADPQDVPAGPTNVDDALGECELTLEVPRDHLGTILRDWVSAL